MSKELSYMGEKVNLTHGHIGATLTKLALPIMGTSFVQMTSYVPEQCNDEKLKKVLKVNDFRHFFLDFIIVTYYN